MKGKTKQKIRGSISILLVVILMPMLVLNGLVVDSSRVNMARAMTSSAGDLTMNTALANYDTILKDVYGLFAMSQNQTQEELAASLQKYFEDTLVSYGVTEEESAKSYVQNLLGDFNEIVAGVSDVKMSNFMKMNIGEDSFHVNLLEKSSLANADILRSQIVQYMKYRAPINVGMSFLDSVNAFKNVEKQNEVVEKQVAAQESYQDVSGTGKALVDAVRKFDRIFDSMFQTGGENAVIGKASDSDNLLVGRHVIDADTDQEELEYPAQVDKYKEKWGNNNNYKHINKIHMVFLEKPVSINNCYLKNFEGADQHYITDTPDVNRSDVIKSGNKIESRNLLNDNDSMSADYLAGQVDSVVGELNKDHLTSVRDGYRAFLPAENLDQTNLLFTNDENAANAYISFEKFLVNQGGITYDSVEKVLEEIYTLDEYYDEFDKKIQWEIVKAQGDVNTKRNQANNLQNSLSAAYNAINSNIDSLNNGAVRRVRNLLDNSASANEIRGALDNDTVFFNRVSNDLMPLAKLTGGTSVRYEAFDNDNDVVKRFKNAYIDIFKKLKLEDYFEYFKEDVFQFWEDYQTDLKDVSKSKEETLPTKSFTSDRPLPAVFQLLNGILDVYNDTNGINEKIKNYNTTFDNAATARNDAAKAEEKLTKRKNKQQSVKGIYVNCVNSYKNFTRLYENDLRMYKKYQQCAQNTVNKESAAVSGQFSKILNNTDSIIKQLDVISENAQYLYQAITKYGEKVEEWETATNNYADDDSFKQQNQDDVENIDTESQLQSLKTLDSYIVMYRENWKEFYGYLTDPSTYCYGSKKIYEIDNFGKVADAVKDKTGSLPAIVTAAAADSLFPGLFKNTQAPAVEYVKKMKELPLQYLKYLYATYPEQTGDDSSLSEEEKKEKEENEEQKQVYEDNKAKLSGQKDSNVETDETQSVNDFYSFKEKKLSTSDGLPSHEKVGRGDGSAGKQFSLGVDGDKVNASDSFDSQKNAMSGVLTGLSQIGEAAMENLYILDYIFENFSYNTILQDQIVNDNNDLKNATNYGKVLEGIKNSENVSNAIPKLKTMSSYPINKANNYWNGAEIEYILYGNLNPETDVALAKGSIYAVRFGFNCIYAFTNSEIRNTTRAAGMAVQAATMGVVPYIVVQIVLQLAIAAAESALDLQMMNSGMKVAVAKTQDTWMLSLSNAAKTLTETVVDNTVQWASDELKSGLQTVIDASADKLNESVENLAGDLTKATVGKGEEIIDTIFTKIQGQIEKTLEPLLYEEYDKATGDVKAAAISKINEAFSHIDVNSAISEVGGDNPVAVRIKELISEKTGDITSKIEACKNEIIQKINNVPSGAQVGDAVVEGINSFKKSISEKMQEIVSDLCSDLELKLEDVIGEARDDIKKYANSSIDQGAETVRKEVVDKTNQFVDDFLDDGTNSSLGSKSTAGKTGSSVASMIKFGYKDYLMLFTFIKVCVNDSETLLRVADLIQLNIQNGSTERGSDFVHKKGMEFNMCNAYTYLTIEAEVDLDMLFLDMKVFNQYLNKDEAEMKKQFQNFSTIKYKGFSGY